MINRISTDEASTLTQGLFMRKNITKGNLIPINENNEPAVLVFGSNSTGELIFKVDGSRSIFFRDGNVWKRIND